MTRRLAFLVLAVTALAFPLVAFAQDAATAVATAPAGGIPIAPILLVLSVLTAIVPFTRFIPGWGTISNVIVGVVSALTIAFTGLAATNPKAAVGIVIVTAIGAITGYLRSEKRNGVRTVPA